jgi:putative aldouronate transport system substrate-binding protein
MISLGFTANEIVRYGQMEEQLLAYNDIVNAKKMPNLYKWIKDKPESVGWFTAPNGKMYTLPGYNGFAQEIGQIKRYFINQTWLSEAGLNTPETLDEFTAMLRAFKNKHPDSVPLGGSANIAGSYTNSGDYILNALGFLLGSVSENQTLEGVPSLRNGNVVIPAYTNIYYEYLRIMRDYFKEGLISSDFFTLDLNTVRALMAEKKTGVTPEPAYLA